jgi:Lar family restriction alleviation protein
VTETELKPCPHCGSAEVSMSYSATMQSPEPFARFVECEECCASGPAVDVAPMGDDAAQSRAAELWNTRA